MTILSPQKVVQTFDLAIAKGEVSGHSWVNKFGRNEVVALSSTETVWDGSNAYTFPSTADATHISQTANQAALYNGDVEIQGLDTNYAVVTQTATLNASDTTTAVALSTALRRVFRMILLENVITTSPIRVHNSGETIDYAQISTGYQQTQMAIYTVPADKTAYLYRYYGSNNKASGNSPEIVLTLWTRDNANGYAKTLKHSSGTNIDGSSFIDHNFAVPLSFPEQTDIWIDAEEVGGSAAADVSAGFDLILVDN